MTAGTPKDAIRLVQETMCGTVILDYMMPTIRGDELAQKLRSINPSINVVVISGHNNVEKEFKAKNMRVDRILKKPVQPDELVTLIRNITSDHT